jgi:DNA polymerase-1
MIERRGWVQNKFGRIYKVPSDKGYKAVNYLIQGTSADLLSERMIVVSEYLEDKKSTMLLQVHDEIICEIHKDEAHEVVPYVKKLLEINSLNIPLQVDLEVCDPSWATKKDFVLTETPKPDTISSYIDWD